MNKRPTFKVSGSRIRLRASSSVRQDGASKVKKLKGRCPTCGKK